nr:alpha/beta hydrolase [Desulfuromonas versatilis]
MATVDIAAALIPSNKELKMQTLRSASLSRFLVLPVLLMAAFLTTSTLHAVEKDDSPPQLGLYLEGVAYPFPVHRYQFTSQGHDLQMAYMDVQPKDAPLKNILLLHGKNFNGAYFGQLAGDLQKAGYRVIIPDQLGFGKSSKPLPYNYTFQQLALNTHNLLESLGIDKVTVLGHSMGGMLATRYALMYPDQANELILMNPIGLEDWKTVVPYQSLDQWYESELNKTAEKIRKYQLASYYDGKWKPEYDAWVDLLAGVISSPGYPQMAKTQALLYDMIFTQPVVYEFPLVKSRTLLLIGTRDRTALGKNLVSPEIGKTMGLYENLGKKTAAAIPDATLVEFDNVGHLPHIEAYERMLPPLLKWLEN